MKFSVVTLTLLLLFSNSALAEYQPPESLSHPKVTIKLGDAEYDVTKEDDTGVLQRAIDAVHAGGGGHVVVPSGEYRFGKVNLKSDVHVSFRNDTVVRSTDGVTGNMFQLTGESGIENVSLIGAEDRLLVDFSDLELNARRRFVAVGDCHNFRIANVNVKDNLTRFSSVILGWEGVREGNPKSARDGLIENFAAEDAQYGFGAIQAHSGENIVFRNILSIGGIAVRLETGLDPMNYASIGGLFNILVEDAISKNGQGAMMMQPHTMDHGDIVGRNIQSDGSEFAVYVAEPFVSKRRTKDRTLTKGSFRSITVDGVKAIYRDGPIVTRFVHLKYYPKALHPMVKAADNGPDPGYVGPSIAAVAVMQKDMANVKITNVEAIGFEHHPDVMRPKDLFQGNWKTIVGKPRGKVGRKTAK